VPEVPAPNQVPRCCVAVEDAFAGGEDDEIGSGKVELAARRREDVGLVFAADAADAEVKTLGQNVSLQS